MTGILIILTIFLVTSCQTLERYSAFPGGPRSLEQQNRSDSGPWVMNQDESDQFLDHELHNQIIDGRTGIPGPDGYGRSYLVSLEGLTGPQEALVKSAMSLIGKNSLVVRGRRFNFDCTGVVLAAYWGAGFDMMPLFNRESGNGVKRLHDIGVRGGTLSTSTRQLPKVGDIIIWDNTYDRNGNGRWDDEFTHNGLVLDVQPNGQITYLHHNYARGIVLARMHLGQLDDHLDRNQQLEINSPMRMRSHRHIRPNQWLSSHLFRAYVEIFPLL
jgi:hypothetical protein